MNILFLDDDSHRVQVFERNTSLKVNHVVTRQEFMDAFDSNRFDVIMLDHDLMQDTANWNGGEAAKYLANNRLIVGDDQQVIIHSANPIGVTNMLSYMQHADHLHVNVIHWAWQKARFNKRVQKLEFLI